MVASMEDTRGPVITGVCIGFAILTFIVLSLRMFSRLYVLGKMGVDDALIIGACLLAWAFIAATLVSVQNGMGKHVEDITSPDALLTYSFSVWLSSMFYLACLGFVKTSALWFYTRLGDRYLTRLSFIMFAVVSAQAIANVLTAAFQCQPTKKAWATSTPGTCININVFYLCNAALNILTDVLTYTLPVRVIFKLQVPRKQKIALMCTLSLGLFACVSSIIRITYIPAMLTSPDSTYVISNAMYWSVIETNVGIFAASIPSFKAIASRFLPRLIGEYSSQKKSYGWSNSGGMGDGTRGKYGAGSNFSRIRDPHATYALRTLNDDGDGPNHGSDMYGTQTNTGFGGNSSEERIIIPEGKILAQTQISTNVEITRASPDSLSFEHAR